MEIKVWREVREVVHVDIHEGRTYADGTPKASLHVEVWKNGEGPAEITWPSTSDKRKELAVTFMRALEIACQISRELDKDGDTRYFPESRVVMDKLRALIARFGHEGENAVEGFRNDIRALFSGDAQEICDKYLGVRA